MTAADRDLAPAAPKRLRLADALAVALGVPDGSDVRRWIRSAPDRVVVGLLAAWDAHQRGDDPSSLATGRCRPITDPRALWEAMASAGLIAAADVDDPRRRFDSGTWWASRDGEDWHLWSTVEGPSLVARSLVYAPIRGRDPSPREREMAPHWRRGETAHPCSVADCVAFAADWDGAQRAELLARAVSEVPAAAIMWRVMSEGVQYEVPQIRGAIARDLRATGYLLGGVGRDGITLLCPGLA